MRDDQTQGSEDYLTKTELIVLDCRRRGMSETAIRRLLHLSESDAVAFGLMRPQKSKPGQDIESELGEVATDVWPPSTGRRKPFGRRLDRRRREQPVGRRQRRREAMKPIRKPGKRGDKV